MFDTDFEIICNNLTDIWYDSQESAMFINLLLDENIWLFDNYVNIMNKDIISVNIDSGISVGNHTIRMVILDNMTLATCTEIDNNINGDSNSDTN